jgi:hypothetical protein
MLINIILIATILVLGIISDNPEAEPITVLEPGINPECVYPLAVLLVPFGFALLVAFRLIARIVG